MACSKPIDNINHALKGINQVLATIKPINLITLIGRFFMSPSLKSAVRTLIQIFELFGCYYITKGTPHIFKLLKLFAQALLNLPRKCIEVYNFVCSLVPSYAHKIENQADGDLEDRVNEVLAEHDIDPKTLAPGWKSSIFPVLLGLLAIIGTSLGAATKTGAAIVKAISLGSACTTNFFRVFTTTGDVFEGLRNFLYTAFGIGSPSQKLIEKNERKEAETAFDDYLKRLHSHNTHLNEMTEILKSDPGQILACPEGPKRISDAITTASELLNECVKHKFASSQARLTLDQLKQSMLILKQQHSISLSSIQGKCEPAVIWLAGTSGIGKSFVVKIILDLLSRLEGRVLTRHYRSPDLKHWDDYSHQDVVIYDDFGQNTENNDHSELFQIYTDAAYVLPMAAVEKKGMLFSSKYVIICSNQIVIEKSKTVTDPTILNRRRDLLFSVRDVEYEKRYQAGTVDAVWRLSHVKPDFSHLRFVRMNPLPNASGQIVEVAGSEYDLITLVRHFYDIKQAKQKSFDVHAARALEHFSAGTLPEPVQVARRSGENPQYVINHKFDLSTQVDVLVDQLTNLGVCSCSSDEYCSQCENRESLCDHPLDQFCQFCYTQADLDDIEEQGLCDCGKDRCFKCQYTVCVVKCEICNNIQSGLFPCITCAQLHKIFSYHQLNICDVRCICRQPCYSSKCKVASAGLTAEQFLMYNPKIYAKAFNSAQDTETMPHLISSALDFVPEMVATFCQKFQEAFPSRTILNRRKFFRELFDLFIVIREALEMECECIYSSNPEIGIRRTFHCRFCKLKLIKRCHKCAAPCFSYDCGRCHSPIDFQLFDLLLAETTRRPEDDYCDRPRCEVCNSFRNMRRVAPEFVGETPCKRAMPFKIRVFMEYFRIMSERFAPTYVHVENQGIEDIILRRIFSTTEKTQSAQVMNQVTETVEYLRHPIIFLLGDAGTGKSTCWRQKYSEKYLFFDDFPTSKFDEVVDLVWKTYDGDLTQGLFITANYDPFILKCQQNGIDPQAFIRRTLFFKFSFKKGWLSSYSNCDLKNNPYHKVVSIQHSNRGKPLANCELDDVADIINSFDIQKDMVTSVIDFPTLDGPCDPQLIISLNRGYTEAMTKLSFSDFNISGSGMKYVPLFLRTFNRFKNRKFRSCSAAIKALSTEKLDVSAAGDVLFKMTDLNILLRIAEDGQCSLYKVPLDFTIEDVERDKIADFLMQLEPVFELLQSLASYALAMWVITDDLMEHKQSLRKRKIEDEGWGSDCEDLPHEHTFNLKPVQTTYQPIEVKRPKSDMQPRSKNQEYCPKHHKMDYCHVSYERFVPRFSAEYDGKNKTHVADNVTYSERIEEREPKETTITRVRENIEALDKTLFSTWRNIDELELAVARERRTLDVLKNPYNTGEVVTWHANLPEASDTFPFERLNRKHKATYVNPEIKPHQRKVGPKNKTQITVKDEAIQDQAALDVCKMVTDNTVYMLNQRGTMLCRGIMVGQRLGVTVKHIADEEGLQVRTKEGTIYQCTTFKNGAARDYICFQLEPRAREFRDIRSHFLKRSDTKSLENERAFVNIVAFNNPDLYVQQRSVIIKNNCNYIVDGIKKTGVEYVGHFDSFSTPGSMTSAGDCGSALVVLNPHMVRKILGIHCAASTMSSFFSIVFQEDLVAPVKTESNGIVFLRNGGIVQADGEFLGFPVVGETVFEGKPVTQFYPHMTKLYTSPFFGILDTELEPCLLSDRDPRNPGHDFVHDGPKKWLHEQPLIDENLLDECVDEWTEFLVGHFQLNHVPMRVLTKTEAINGISAEGSNPIYRHSSAGYPLKHLKGVNHKAQFFEQNKETLLWSISKDDYGNKLNDLVDRIVDTCRNGQRPACAFVCSLKDEARKKSKIYDTPATRTFAACGVDYTIAQRMYFHTASAGFTALHHILPPKIGIDTKSLEWNDLWFYMAGNSDVGFDMDFKDWDATVPKRFMQVLPTIYNRLYQICDPKWKPEDDIIRYNIHSVVHGPLLIIDNKVVQAPGGQVSGQPMTALDNCLVNMLYSLYIWKKLAPPDQQSFSAYYANVRIAVYGDDNITTVKPQALSFFNFETYAEECKKLNLNVTTADKTSDIKPFIKLKDMSFLKMNFVKIDGYMLGRCEESSIQKMLSYNHGTRNHVWFYEKDKYNFTPEVEAENVKNALIFAATHPAYLFDYLKKELTKRAARFGIPIKEWPTQKSLLRDYYFRQPANLSSDN